MLTKISAAERLRNALAANGGRRAKRVSSASESIPFVAVLHPSARELKPVTGRQERIPFEAQKIRQMIATLEHKRSHVIE